MQNFWINVEVTAASVEEAIALLREGSFTITSVNPGFSVASEAALAPSVEGDC